MEWPWLSSGPDTVGNARVLYGYLHPVKRRIFVFFGSNVIPYATPVCFFQNILSGYPVLGYVP